MGNCIGFKKSVAANNNNVLLYLTYTNLLQTGGESMVYKCYIHTTYSKKSIQHIVMDDDFEMLVDIDTSKKI